MYTISLIDATNEQEFLLSMFQYLYDQSNPSVFIDILQQYVQLGMGKSIQTTIPVDMTFPEYLGMLNKHFKCIYENEKLTDVRFIESFLYNTLSSLYNILPSKYFSFNHKKAFKSYLYWIINYLKEVQGGKICVFEKDGTEISSVFLNNIVYAAFLWCAFQRIKTCPSINKERLYYKRLVIKNPTKNNKMIYSYFEKIYNELCSFFKLVDSRTFETKIYENMRNKTYPHYTISKDGTVLGVDTGSRDGAASGAGRGAASGAGRGGKRRKIHTRKHKRNTKKHRKIKRNKTRRNRKIERKRNTRRNRRNRKLQKGGFFKFFTKYFTKYGREQKLIDECTQKNQACIKDQVNCNCKVGMLLEKVMSSAYCKEKNIVNPDGSTSKRCYTPPITQTATNIQKKRTWLEPLFSGLRFT